jgi:hypothetical protein
MSEARVIYITSPARSGSTLLDQMLAAHPLVVSIGEALQLAAYALEDRALYDPAHPLVCSCGQPLRLCSFWQAVEREVGSPLSSLELRPGLLDLRGATGWRTAFMRQVFAPIRRWPQLYRQALVHGAVGGRRIGRDSFRLYDAIATVTGARYVLDSSKVPFRYWSVHQHRPRDVWLIVLTRDYRAVAYSQSKRGHSLLGAARYWVQTMKQIDIFSAGLAPDRLHVVKYEDLCADPETVMRKLCAFLELDFTASTMSRASSPVHHLGGSPSKFDPARRVPAADLSFLNHLTQADLRSLHQVAGDHALRWGYV